MRNGSKVLMTLIQCSSTADGSTSQSLIEAANIVSLWICASWPTIPVTMVQAGGKENKKKTQMLCLFLSLKSNTITQYFSLIILSLLERKFYFPACVLDKWKIIKDNKMLRIRKDIGKALMICFLRSQDKWDSKCDGWLELNSWKGKWFLLHPVYLPSLLSNGYLELFLLWFVSASWSRDTCYLLLLPFWRKCGAFSPSLFGIHAMMLMHTPCLYEVLWNYSINLTLTPFTILQAPFVRQEFPPPHL